MNCIRSTKLVATLALMVACMVSCFVPGVANAQQATSTQPSNTAPAKTKAEPPKAAPANKAPTQATAANQPPTGNKPAGEPAPPPDLSIPAGADRAALLKVISTAKGFRPRNPGEYRLQQTALRDASSALIKQIENKDDPVRMQAELDALTANASLMVYESDEARDKVFEKITTYLKSRKQLTLADVQTGIIVATFLELQPRKQPARDVYATMVELLQDDEREEMQSLRFNLQATVRRLEMLGNKFPLSAESIEGKPLKIEDYAGKFVIVDFFATWCKPCIDEMPRLKKHYEKHHDKGLEIITISLDNERSDLDKYLADAKLPWTVIHDSAEQLEDKLQSTFGIASLPTVLLLNKEGVVVSLEAHGAELDRLMDRLFEMPTPAEPEEKPAEGKK